MNTLNKWKHWPAFWALCREHDVCQESDKERLGKCEINVGGCPYFDANQFKQLCLWFKSGFAGDIMLQLSSLDKGLEELDLSTYTPKTAPLPIVKPCHRCGTNHDEANPPPYCVKILERDQRIAELELDNGLLKLCIEQSKTHIESAENHIAELEAKLSISAESAKQAIITLNGMIEISHDECDDPFYSCPKHPEYIGHDDRNYCRCGTDQHNKSISKVISILITPTEAQNA